ncbi:MAG TPA: hypothetical protein VFN10_18345 [Thermoanaerobaculia bacterium]|nr:hypothetical protein [Thermoanaerobaculia bacterium]
MRTFIAAAILAIVSTSALYAQSPAADWQTVETEHFRIHYPREYGEWSLRVASHIESIRAAVATEVGFSPAQKIDILIANPVAAPNGSAWPLLDSPRMIFYAEPPGPEEQLGEYGHWIDLLAVHEVTHTVHMLRPSRNTLSRILEKTVLPLNPITLRAPRWVLEGYATVVEGRLTGAGRPSSTMRAIILRQWALNGRMPSYSQLNSDRRFLGMSMAYLVGSAYLEWLEQHRGAGSLQKVWTRLTAREKRTFDGAFAGVFGESPERLYGRFVAELTASAVSIDRARSEASGALFQETTRSSGDPDISPDGKQIAVVLRPREKPPRLVIWSTGDAAEEEKKFSERLQRILKRDPEDVAPVREKPLPRKAVHELTMPDGGDIREPRWTRDGRSVIFAHRQPDADGFLHFDLFKWTPAVDEVTRLTNLADVSQPDPLPDGRTAVAVRSRFGASQLVKVDLADGSVTDVTEPSIDVVYAHPRASPDGTRAAVIIHRDGAWQPVIRELTNGSEYTLTLPPRTDASAIEWLANDSLVATLSSGGFAELHRLSISGDPLPLTRTRGGAFWPAPSPDGRTFFMSLEPDGYVLRVLPAGAPTSAPVSFANRASLVPALPPEPPAATPFAAQAFGTPHPYGVGKQEWSWFAGQNFAPDHHATEIGIRLGDFAGRLDTIAIASIASKDAPDGFALATAWRGWPVDVLLHAFTSNRRLTLPGGERVKDDDRGAELRGSWSRMSALHRFTIDAGLLTSDARDLGFVDARAGAHQLRGSLRADEELRVEADSGDATHYRIAAAASLKAGSLRFGARAQHDHISDGSLALGGLASSIVPRSGYYTKVLDPALPAGTLHGDTYNGWRVDAVLPVVPLTAFYQRHELSSERVSLAGAEVAVSVPPNPILKSPAFDMTLGVARILDAPLEGDTKWWLGLRWRP